MTDPLLAEVARVLGEHERREPRRVLGEPHPCGENLWLVSCSCGGFVASRVWLRHALNAHAAHQAAALAPLLRRAEGAEADAQDCRCNVGVQECPAHPGRLLNQEERIAYRKAWDARATGGAR